MRSFLFVSGREDLKHTPDAHLTRLFIVMASGQCRRSGALLLLSGSADIAESADLVSRLQALCRWKGANALQVQLLYEIDGLCLLLGLLCVRTRTHACSS